jgi:hypothetical protein
MIGQTMISYNYLPYNSERFRGILFDNEIQHIINLMTTPVNGLTLGFTGQMGKFIYRSETPEMGKGYNLYTSVDYMPFSRLKLSFSWTTAKLDNVVTGEEFYYGHILRNITTFQFTKKLFLRGITQYDSFAKAFNIYPLISYKFNAFTMFCAGMTQNFQKYGQTDIPLRTTGYQYFIKLQYLFSL